MTSLNKQGKLAQNHQFSCLFNTRVETRLETAVGKMALAAFLLALLGLSPAANAATWSYSGKFGYKMLEISHN